ncbi:TatD family hydrolase [Candidatus Gracilibacteria bacterium]|nr:TatD family hydrolase [Candidatus Gracilibacteria bacterium]
MIYDTHCHPYLAKNKTTQDILETFKSSGSFLNSIGVDINSSLKSVELSKQHDFIYSTIGIHPCDITDLDLAETIIELERIYLANKNNIVAIGETGLDYYWMEKDGDKLVKNIADSEKAQEIKQKYISQTKALQKLFFRAQIELARTHNLPIIIHNRDSREDILKILKETDFKNFIFHCYSEDLDYARQLLAFSPNCKISFSGIVTFKNAADIQNTAANISLNNIVIETDSPYLTPEPHRGRQENEPAFVEHVLEKIISLRSESPQQIKEQIFQNSLEIFQIKKSLET